MNKAIDKARLGSTVLLDQLDHVSKIVSMLTDPIVRDSVNFDSKYLAELTSQVLISLKLLTNEPTFTNISLVFINILCKLNLPDDLLQKSHVFIKRSLELCVASISSLGFSSEGSLKSIVEVMTSMCGVTQMVLEDKVIDITLTFLAKLVSFWASISGGFEIDNFDISKIPEIVSYMRSLSSQGGDIIECLLASYNFITEEYPKFFKGDFSGLIFGKTETNVFEVKVSKLKKIYPLVQSGSWDILKEEYNITESSYMSEVTELIKVGERMMKKAKPAQLPAFKRYLDELREIRVDQSIKKAQIQTKVTAFGVCFVGDSGIGKSLLMDSTSRVLIQASGEVPTTDKIVTGSLGDKYDSNELPHHLSIQYDDVANNNSNENFDKLLNAINSQARPFLKASVEEKGTMFPGNVACVISTNVPGINAAKSNCKDSIGRRFLHIEVSIKEELIDQICVPGTKRVDTLKASKDGSPRMDIWKFNVYEFVTFEDPGSEGVPEGCIRWEGMTVRPLKWTDKKLKDQTFWDLATFLGQKARKHFDTQMKILSVMKDRQIEKFCEECCVPCSVCSCSVQSEFLSLDVDVGIQRLTSYYQSYMDVYYNCLDMMKWRTLCLVISLLMPYDIKKLSFASFCISFIISLIIDRSISTICLLSIICFVVGYIGSAVIVFLRLRREVASRFGVITHLAESTADVVRRNRNSIFIGSIMVSFLYLVYKSFRPRSEQMSYRESLPEVIRSAFRRAEIAKTTPLDNILPLMKRDLGTISVKYGNKEQSCLVFPIEANFFLTVNHILPTTGDFTVEIIHENTFAPTVAKQKLSQQHVYRFKGKDLALIQIPSAVPRKGYKNYLLLKPQDIGTQVIKVITMDIMTKYRTVSDTRLKPGWSFLKNSITTTDGVCIHKPYQYASPVGTKNGMCGSLIVDFDKSIIYGFHVAGNGTIGLCSTITASEIDEAMTHFKGFIPLNQGELQLGSNALEKDPGFCDLQIGNSEHDKLLEDHNCVIEGIIPGASATFRHPYKEHPFYTSVVEKFGEPKFGPPREINSHFHKRKALTKLTTPNQEFSLSEIDDCVQDYITPVIKHIHSLRRNDRLELARSLSVQEALDGISESCLGGVDNSTSVGFPFKGKKKNYLRRDEMDPDIPLTPRELISYNGINILEELDEMRNRYLSGQTCRPLFKCSMKVNELLPVHKLKGRVFMGANFPFLILCRQYLSPLIRLVSRNRFLFETAKGINMDSIECEQLYKFLFVEEGKRVVALDYSAYDQTMSAQVTSAVAGMIVTMLEELGCDNEHILIARGLLTDIIYPNLHYFGTVIQLANSDPSGNPITTELNGMVNSLYLRAFFFRIYPELKGKKSYRDIIKTMTYGDDNINGVPEAYSKFNGVNIVEEGKKVGLSITMADKDAEITEFTTISDSDFLKRKFRYCSDLGHIRAPLAKESITKSLYYYKITSPDSPEVLFSQNVDGALRKASQHGRNYFEEIRCKLLEIAKQFDVVNICHWWTYDDLIKHDKVMYYDNYETNMHPSLEADIDIIKNFVSEGKNKKKHSILYIICQVLIATSITTLTTSAVMWINDDGIKKVCKFIAQLIQKGEERYREFSEEMDIAYRLNGTSGVAELLHLPKNLVDQIFKMGVSSGSFRSESFTSEYFEQKPQKTSRSLIMLILYYILDTFISFKPFSLTGRIGEIGMSTYGYMGTLFSLISLSSLLGIDKTDGMIANYLNASTREARRVLASLILRNNNEVVRKQAFCIYFEGSPGSGKTFASLMIMKRLIPKLKRHEVIILNEEDEFQSELRSHHKVIVMDDVCNTDNNYVTTSPFRRPLDFVNNSPRRALNPEAELKGNIVVEPELVILTSNYKANHIASYTHSPESLYRRWIRVVLVKTGPFDKDFDTDHWEFRVYSLDIETRDSTRAYSQKKYKDTYDTYTYNDFLEFITKEYNQHNIDQTKLVNQVNMLFDQGHSKWDIIPEWIFGSKFKSESSDDTLLLNRLWSREHEITIDNIIDILREEKNHIDIEYNIMEEYTWWDHLMILLGIKRDMKFRSEAFKYQTFNDFPQKVRDIFKSTIDVSRGYLVHDDYVYVELDYGFSLYPLTFQGIKACSNFDKEELCLYFLDEFYPIDTIKRLYDESEKRALYLHNERQININNAIKSFETQDYFESLPDNFKSESLENDTTLIDKLVNKIYDDKKYMLIYIRNNIESLLFNHYLKIDINEYESDDESSKFYDSFNEDKDYSNITPMFERLMAKHGIITLRGQIPSNKEYLAQQAALQHFPDYEIVAREVTLQYEDKQISCDLVLFGDSTYNFIEAKHRGERRVTDQAKERKQFFLDYTPIRNFCFYAYTLANDRLIKLK